MIGKTISHLPRGIKGSEPCAFNIQAHKEVIFDSNHLSSHGVNKILGKLPDMRRHRRRRRPAKDNRHNGYEH